MSNTCANVSDVYSQHAAPVTSRWVSRTWSAWASATCVIVWCIVCRSGFTIETYPWFFPDSYDWVVNGLAYARPEVPFEISHRGLLFTLLMAGLFRVGAPDLISFSGTVAFVLVLAVTARGLSRLGYGTIACNAVVLLILSHPFLSQSAFVGSDVLACVFLSGLTFSYLRYLKLNERRALMEAAAWAGFGIHSQYIEVVWLPILGLLTVLDERPSGISVRAHRLFSLITSAHFWIAFFIGLTCAALPLVPRLLTYGTVYSPRVTHLPLVSPNLANAAPYAFGLIGQIGWPIVAFAFLGLASGLKTSGKRLLTVTATLWTLTIGGFFVFFYTWYDCRFAIYITVPICVLAAIGLLATFDFFKIANVSTLHGNLVRSAVLFIVSLTQILRPDSNVFSDSLLLIPNLSIRYDSHRGLQIDRNKLSIPLLESWKEGEQVRELVSQGSLDLLTRSQHVASLFHTLRSMNSGAVFTPPPVQFEYLAPDQWYYVHNRNIMYFGSRVDTFSSISDTIGALRESRNGYLLAREDALRKIFSALPPASIVATAGPYFLVDAPSLVKMDLLRRFPRGVKAVETDGDAYAIFDSIIDSASNYCASPLGKSTKIVLDGAVGFSRLHVYLYDFDHRTYRFAVTVGERGIQREIYSSPPIGDQGLVTIELPSDQIQTISLVGLSNSDTSLNPANAIFHIKEITLVPR